MASTVTPFSDMDPSPRVDVFIDDADLDVAAETITVWQQSTAGQLRVRNAIHRTAAGGFFIVDYEVPLGVEVTYRVEQFNSSGTSLGFALSLNTQVDIELGKAIFQDPLVPSNAVAVYATTEFGSSLVRSRRMQLHRTGYDTVAMLGQKGLLENVPLHCETETLEDADLLETILGETMLLVRVMAGTSRVPLLLHVGIGDPDQRPVDVAFGGEIVAWDLQGNEVSRTEIDIIIPVVTWQRVIDYYATWTDLIAAHSTWLDLLRNPPPEA